MRQRRYSCEGIVGPGNRELLEDGAVLRATLVEVEYAVFHLELGVGDSFQVLVCW